jgi:NAD(P)H-flavin reductase
MGVNTVDTFTHPHVFLFAFGIGAGVIRAIAHHVVQLPETAHVTIVTGNRNEDEIIYKDYFDALALANPHVSVRHVLSRPFAKEYPYVGYIQDHIDDLTFTRADIYLCGQKSACDSLVKKIESLKPEHASFFIEAFH